MDARELIQALRTAAAGGDSKAAAFATLLIRWHIKKPRTVD